MSESGRGPATAIVTGASRGIGLAIATRFVQRGMRIVMLARGEEALAHRAGELGAEAIPIRCDVAVPDEVDAMLVRTLDLFGGPPDVLVNNAGLFHLARVGAETPDRFATTIAANVLGPFRIVNALVPMMRQRGAGHIVTIGSVADRAAYAENAAYAASKHAARAVHEVLRSELDGSGVRVSLVSPGPVDTPLWDPLDPDRRPGFTPRAEMLTPAAVADAVEWVVTRDRQTNVDELRLSRA